MLRLDLQRHYPQTCKAVAVFTVLQSTFDSCSATAHRALCQGLPILTTWDTPSFVAGNHVQYMVKHMLKMCNVQEVLVDAMKGLGQLSNVVLDRFAPFLEETGQVALGVMNTGVENHRLASLSSQAHNRQAAQQLLGRLLAALGPMVLDIMVEYLHSPPAILLSDVKLLESIAILLPKLAPRIILTITEIIEDLINGKTGYCKMISVASA